MPPLLAVRDLVKRRRGRSVLAGVSFAVAPGEVVGIVGENGSGKTTLLEVLAGRLRRDGGAVSLRGRLGYCPQEPRVFAQLTLRENFRFFGAAYGLEDWGRRMGALLERYRASAWTDRLAGEVSGGTVQKLNLALALVHDPDLLLLDEPCSGLDWEAYLRFWDHVGEFRARGCGVVVVSHLLHDRERFDRIHELQDGRIAP